MKLAAHCALGSALISAGCSLVVDAESLQCRVDADCAARGASFADTLCRQQLCVREEAVGGESTDEADGCAVAVPSGTENVTYSFATLLPIAGGPLAQSPFSIRACEQLDLDCAEPVLGAVEVLPAVTHAFELPSGFSGFFQITHPGTLPALYFMSRPVVTDTVGWSPTLLSGAILAQLAEAAGTPLDPSTGLVIASVRDCNGEALAGATVTSSAESALRYYIVNSLPVLSATETGPQGAVGFASVPASTIVLNGQTASGARLAPVSVRVRAGFISLAELRP